MKKFVGFLVFGLVVGFYIYPKFFPSIYDRPFHADEVKAVPVPRSEVTKEANSEAPRTLKTERGTIIVSKITSPDAPPETPSEENAPEAEQR